MEYAAINGILDSLDPHSALLAPKIFNEFKTQTEGEFGGIGIVQFRRC
jgi:carboxyl-terminal processing protease